ncbi:MAG: hypothetical protein ACU0D2_04820 [Roseovarius indicus]
MMTIANTITLDALRHMAVGDIEALPAEELARLQNEADDAFHSAKSLRDWLEGAIALRYGEPAAQARHEAGKGCQRQSKSGPKGSAKCW